MIIETAFENNENIPMMYTCEGENISPPFDVSELPERAKSLAITMIDSDAKNFVHWVIYNIPLSGKDLRIEENTSLGVQGENSLKERKYAGPCPPSGKHKYIFSVYALDSILSLDPGQKEDLEKAMLGHILDSQILVGYYEKGGEEPITSETQIIS